MSSTASYAQTGSIQNDTVRCYGITELKLIAASLVAGRACDTTVIILKDKLKNREDLILEKNKQIKILNSQSHLKDLIIEEKQNKIKSLQDDLNTKENQKRWLKFGWSSTSVVLSGLLVYFIVN